MKKHQGEIIESAVRNSGYSLKEVAKRMGVSRSTLYNRFGAMDISNEFISKLAKLIHHDFSKDFPHLKEGIQFREVQEGFATYQASDQRELLFLQKKYCELLEVHNRLLKLAIKVSSAKGNNILKLQKEIIDFVESNTGRV